MVALLMLSLVDMREAAAQLPCLTPVLRTLGNITACQTSSRGNNSLGNRVCGL